MFHAFNYLFVSILIFFNSHPLPLCASFHVLLIPKTKNRPFVLGFVVVVGVLNVNQLEVFLFSFSMVTGSGLKNDLARWVLGLIR